MNILKSYTFDDLLLVPQYSEIMPAETDLNTRLTKKINLSIPVLSAAMDTVTEKEMAFKMAVLGGASVIHKNMLPDIQAKQVEEAKLLLSKEENKSNLGVIGAAVGVNEIDLERVKLLTKAGVDFIVVDTAHGHSKKVLDMVELIKNKFDIELIAGNIATSQAAEDLIKRGADALKVGIGPGSICTTRIISGVGVPQITAIMNVVSVSSKYNIPVIADGGIKYSGDAVKALAVGASSVMFGSMFSGTAETPGKILQIEDKKYKVYRGMGSLGAMEDGSGDRYFQTKAQGKFVPEGIEGITPYKGKVEDIIYQILGGIKSGMGYMGARTIAELAKTASFVEISNQGLKESHVHDVMMSKDAPNYKG